MANPALPNGTIQHTKLSRCASSVGDGGIDKAKVGWTSPRDIWRNLSLRRKAEVNASTQCINILVINYKNTLQCMYFK